MHDFENMHAFDVFRNKLISNKYVFLNFFYSNRQKKINYNCFFLSVVAMIAYMTHVFDDLIGAPRTNHYLAIVANRFI